jgi:DNA polymerase-3 subunit delta
MYFDDFLTRLKKGDLPGMILLFGDSEGVIAEGLQSVREKFRQSAPDGNQQVFDGQANSLGEALMAAQTSSLFATAQLLILQHAEKALGGRSEEAVENLKSYFSNPNPASTLVFLAPGMRKTAKAVGAIERMGWAVQCSDIPEWKMAGWLKQQAQALGLGLPEDAAQILVQKVGMDIAYLKGALEQLSLYAYPQKSVTAEMVRELPVPGIESEIFQFLDAVGSRRPEKALQLLNRLEDGVDAGTVMMLYGRMRELLLISLGRAKGWDQGGTAEKLGLHPFRLKSLWDQASQFSPEDLKGALADLIHLQAGVVTGRLGKAVPQVYLECWVLKWGRKRELPAGGRQTSARY